MTSKAMDVTIVYRNYRGETAERRIKPQRIWYGATEWHPEPQWLLEAHDYSRDSVRNFAISEIQSWTTGSEN